jgi:hypothetical protein
MRRRPAWPIGRGVLDALGRRSGSASMSWRFNPERTPADNFDHEREPGHGQSLGRMWLEPSA